MTELVLPAFMLDCRDWLVVSPQDAGLATQLEDVPTVAILSTMVIDDDIREATGALTVGLLDDELLDARQVAPGADALELLDHDALPGTRRYVMPAPTSPGGAQNLALLAEFAVGERTSAPGAPESSAAAGSAASTASAASTGELNRRVDALMTSFRWQSVPA